MEGGGGVERKRGYRNGSKINYCCLAAHTCVSPSAASRGNVTDLINNNNNHEILIKCEPLVYTRARRAVLKKKEENKKRKKKKRKARTIQQQ